MEHLILMRMKERVRDKERSNLLKEKELSQRKCLPSVKSLTLLIGEWGTRFRKLFLRFIH